MLSLPRRLSALNQLDTVTSGLMHSKNFSKRLSFLPSLSSPPFSPTGAPSDSSPSAASAIASWTSAAEKRFYTAPVSTFHRQMASLVSSVKISRRLLRISCFTMAGTPAMVSVGVL